MVGKFSITDADLERYEPDFDIRTIATYFVPVVIYQSRGEDALLWSAAIFRFNKIPSGEDPETEGLSMVIVDAI